MQSTCKRRRQLNTQAIASVPADVCVGDCVLKVTRLERIHPTRRGSSTCAACPEFRTADLWQNGQSAAQSRTVKDPAEESYRGMQNLLPVSLTTAALDAKTLPAFSFTKFSECPPTCTPAATRMYINTRVCVCVWRGVTAACVRLIGGQKV